MEKKMTKKKITFNAYTAIFFILLCVYTFLLLVILCWGFIKSLHEFDDFILGGSLASSWPGKFTLTNYSEAFSIIRYPLATKYGGGEIYFAEMFFNSVVYATGSATVSVLTTCIMAYVTVKHRFAFNKVINAIFYFTLLVPIVGAMPASIRITNALNLMDKWYGIFFMKLTFVGGVGFLIFQAAFKSLDDGYKEAALIDGASHFHIMVLISFPLVKTTIMTLFMMSFIGFWNDYQTPMIYMPTHPTAAYGLYVFNNNQNPRFAFITYKVAGFMVLLLPILFIFLILKDKMMGGLTEGGLKG